MIREQIKRLFDEKFEIAPFGALYSGKSTLLHFITKMQGFFNIPVIRETSTMWRF
jgi:hypothetical protein